MTNIVPWLSVAVLAVALASAFARRGQGTEEREWSLRSVAFALVACVALVGFGPAFANPPLVLGIAALLAGGACLTSARGQGSPWVEAAVLGLAVTAADGLGALGLRDRFTDTGGLLALAAALASIAGWGAASARQPAMARWVALATFALLATLLAFRYFFLRDLAWLAILGMVVAGVVSHMLDPEPEGHGFPALLAAIAWLAAATIAFSYRQGLGVSVVALSGVAVAILLGSARSMATTAPILALGAYRLHRELNPDLTKAFDIGQHYALVGVMGGVLAVLALAQWVRVLGGRLSSAPALLAGLSCTIGVVAAGAFLGAKGVVGLVLGLGLGSAVAAAVAPAGGAELALGLGLTATLTAAQPTFSAMGEPGRDVKVGMLAAVAVVVSALAVMAGRLARPKGGVAIQP